MVLCLGLVVYETTSNTTEATSHSFFSQWVCYLLCWNTSPSSTLAHQNDLLIHSSLCFLSLCCILAACFSASALDYKFMVSKYSLFMLVQYIFQGLSHTKRNSGKWKNGNFLSLGFSPLLKSRVLHRLTRRSFPDLVFHSAIYENIKRFQGPEK